MKKARKLYQICKQFTRSPVARSALMTAGVLLVQLARGQSLNAEHPSSPAGIRAGGVLEQSHAYHRGLPYTPLARVPRYSYGFPVPTYRWGWFGAAHYYPRTTSHRGYNGDYWQWAYRRGY